MKKSEIYRICQHLVLRERDLYPDSTRLEVLRELFQQEDLAKYQEEQEAKQE